MLRMLSILTTTFCPYTNKYHQDTSANIASVHKYERRKIIPRRINLLHMLQNCAKLSQNDKTISFPPTDLYTWCPHTSFCEQSQVDPDLTTSDYGDDVVPCCSSCSCSEDCGRKRNCCKYEYDLYRLDETLDTICKQLKTEMNRGNLDEPFYHIIRACPDRSRVCDSDQVKDYNPVYSYDSGMMYYNPACAECHGQQNTTSFKQLITCPILLDSYFSSVFNVRKGNVTSECLLNFIPPADLDLSTEICHKQTKQQCLFKDFNESGIYDQLCKSFNATFNGESTIAYNNVYCFLCSSANAYMAHLNTNIWSAQHVFCPRRDNYKTGLEATFSLLLDSSDDGQTSSEAEYPGRTWCIKAKNEVICRPMIWPEGQVFINGTCRHLGSAWSFKNVGISIYLSTPPGATSVSEDDIVGPFLVAGSKLSRPVLERPGFEDWDLTLLYNVNSQNTVRYFIALLLQRNTTVVPKEFLRNITTSLNGEWKLHTNERTFNLKPRFSKHTGYVSPKKDSSYLPKWYSFGNTFGDAAKKNIEMDRVQHYLGNRSILGARSGIDVIYITKLFFCTLVELENDDWVDWLVRVYLLNEGKIEDGEFIVAMDEYGDFHVRICLEDFQQSGTRRLIPTAQLMRTIVFFGAMFAIAVE